MKSMMSDYDSQAIIGWQEDETMLYTQKGVREAKPRASPSLALKAASSRLDRRPEKRK